MSIFGSNLTDSILIVWFALTAISVVYVAWDLFTNTPAMKVMKWGWILVTVYTGPIGLIVYWFSCREPAPGTHEEFIAPLWKQSLGSTIHCVAGDATGIIVAASITGFFGLPMGIDAIVEYLAGFAFGLFIFQALFMKDMIGGSYWRAVKSTVLPEWLSMNAVMSGMIPVMILLMTRDVSAMEPTSLRFWGIMSLASLVGAVLAYPVNIWLVANELKHGMGTERALGKGGAKMSTGVMELSGGNVRVSSKLIVTFITLVMLVTGGWLATRYGDISKRPPARSHSIDHRVVGKFRRSISRSTTAYFISDNENLISFRSSPRTLWFEL